MSRDNAGLRILSPRQTTQGHDSSLKNTYGTTLLNGAQCFVIDEEANYRFLKHSVLHADGKFVVEPVDRSGRWVRDSGGTFGIAIIRDSKAELLVQFALDGNKLVYTGSVPRFACIVASGQLPQLSVEILRDKELLVFPSTEPLVWIRPGDRISIRGLSDGAGDAAFSLTVVLG